MNFIGAPAPHFARATVRANDDPKKRGRIRVEYHWMGAQSAELPSEWARVCFPYASKDSGAWFIPEVGDEVLVAFENGNLDYPIILGTLFNGKNTPPQTGRTGDYNADGANALKFIRTRAGHLLCFDDADSGGGVLVQDKDGRKIEIKSGGKEIEIADTSGNKVVLTESGITIQSAKQINLGEGAAHALVHGDTFQQLFNAHTHPTSSGSTGPPVTPLLPTMLSQKVKTV